MDEEEEDSIVLSMMQQCLSSVVVAELPKKRKRDHRELPREGKGSSGISMHCSASYMTTLAQHHSSMGGNSKPCLEFQRGGSSA